MHATRIACSGLESSVFLELTACVTHKRRVCVILGHETSLPSAFLHD